MDKYNAFTLWNGSIYFLMVLFFWLEQFEAANEHWYQHWFKNRVCSGHFTFITYLLNLPPMKELKPTTVAVYLSPTCIYNGICFIGWNRDELNLKYYRRWVLLVGPLVAHLSQSTLEQKNRLQTNCVIQKCTLLLINETDFTSNIKCCISQNSLLEVRGTIFALFKNAGGWSVVGF
jgi:hypothetical protein